MKLNCKKNSWLNDIITNVPTSSNMPAIFTKQIFNLLYIASRRHSTDIQYSTLLLLGMRLSFNLVNVYTKASIQ